MAWKASSPNGATVNTNARRSRDWIKIKVVTTADFVIGGFTHGERDYFSSLVLGFYEDGKLVHVGQVGTGFNEKSLKEIYSKIEPLITKKSPFPGSKRCATSPG